jgi:cysteine desulfurase
MKQARIYLDYQATTPVDPRVLDSMLPYFSHNFGNPSSRFHSFGWTAQKAVDESKRQIASCLNVESDGIIFTSGSTESNNLAIFGIAEGLRSKGRHLITCTTEHKSVLEACLVLENRGWEITRVPVDTYGIIDLRQLETSIRPDTVLISIMTVNNEIGVLHPVDEIGEIASKRGVLFHTDATQAIGKIHIDLHDNQIDLLSLSAHKIYGPKGIGALIINNRKIANILKPMIVGGAQQNALRPGTLNVPGIVGFGRAAELARQDLGSEVIRLKSLRDLLWNTISTKIDDAVMNGSRDLRVCNNLNVSFPGIESQRILMALDDIALSLGSACTGADIEPSHVLQALYKRSDDTRIHSAIRFGVGRYTTEDEITYTAKRVIETIPVLRGERNKLLSREKTISA